MQQLTGSGKIAWQALMVAGVVLQIVDRAIDFRFLHGSVSEEAFGCSFVLDFGGSSTSVQIMEASGLPPGCCPAERNG